MANPGVGTVLGQALSLFQIPGGPPPQEQPGQRDPQSGPHTKAGAGVRKEKKQNAGDKTHENAKTCNHSSLLGRILLISVGGRDPGSGRRHAQHHIKAQDHFRIVGPGFRQSGQAERQKPEKEPVPFRFGRRGLHQ